MEESAEPAVPPQRPAPGAAAASTRAVERALDLLSAVCTSGEITLSEAGRRTGVPASTALRLLRTLEQRHFVVRDEESSWRAGPRLLQLAVRSLGREPLARLARVSLARLASETGESAYLSSRGGDSHAVHVAAAEGTQPVRYAAWVGHTEPLHGSATGRALLGQVDAEGFTVGPASGADDVVAVAAPVRRPGGIVAAVSVVGPAYRFGPEQVQIAGRQVVAEAARLEAALGAVGAVGAVSGLAEDVGVDEAVIDEQFIDRQTRDLHARDRQGTGTNSAGHAAGQTRAAVAG
jgi:urocanate hydratase